MRVYLNMLGYSLLMQKKTEFILFINHPTFLQSRKK